MVPLVIFSRPATIRSVVDFPHPEGPTSTINSPFSMCKLIFLTAVNVGRPRSSTYVFTKFLISTDPSLMVFGSWGFILLSHFRRRTLLLKRYQLGVFAPCAAHRRFKQL